MANKKGKAKSFKAAEKGAPVLPVNFPPYNPEDSGIKEKHQEMQLSPSSDIASYIRHIPYNSNKRTLQQQTGRDSLEVFQYEFAYNGRMLKIMWDYNLGLVRITPFFKASGFAKTMPQKAIGMNAGLDVQCYSITGGSIDAQGYWMPFEAAKALAATFCYDIRYGLTPMFGNNFPELCISPHDPAFKRFAIDPRIVQKCADETLAWAVNAEEHRNAEKRSASPAGVVPSTEDEAPPAHRLRKRASKSYSIDDSESYQTSRNGGEYIRPRPTTESKKKVKRNYHSSNDFTTTSGSGTPWLSSVPTSPGVKADTSMPKRVYEDAKYDADESSATSSQEPIGNEKRRRVDENHSRYRSDEMEAAYALLLLSRMR